MAKEAVDGGFVGGWWKWIGQLWAAECSANSQPDDGHSEQQWSFKVGEIGLGKQRKMKKLKEIWENAKNGNRREWYGGELEYSFPF